MGLILVLSPLLAAASALGAVYLARRLDANARRHQLTEQALTEEPQKQSTNIKQDQQTVGHTRVGRGRQSVGIEAQHIKVADYVSADAATTALALKLWHDLEARAKKDSRTGGASKGAYSRWEEQIEPYEASRQRKPFVRIEQSYQRTRWHEDELGQQVTLSRRELARLRELAAIVRKRSRDESEG